MRGTDKVGLFWLVYFPADSIMWIISDKPTLSIHNPHYQLINLVYRRPMSNLFDKPTLSVDKPGLLNSIMWVNFLYRPIM